MTTLEGVPDASGEPAVRVKRRPKDRKAQITRAAAVAFSAEGYHAASMEAIAAKVGISAPALYRHYPSKYDMFVAAVLALGQQLVDCTDFVDDVADTEVAADPHAVLDRVVDALIEVALLNRESGGLYRWHTRYLHAEDQSRLMHQVRVVNRRIQRPLLVIRPALTSPQRWTLSSGLLSVIGSVVDHRVRLPVDEIHAVLAGAVSGLLAAELPKPEDAAAGRPSVWRMFPSDGGSHDMLLHEAMVLIGDRGYAETSMNQIADAAGVPVSGIYRYFPSKRDILTTGLRVAAERVAGELSAIMSIFAEPRQVLMRLIEAYVETSFANHDLSALYYTERVNLPPADQALLRSVQRSMIDAWVQLLTSVRSELSAAQARVLVHAATGLVADLGRLARPSATGDEQLADRSAYLQVCVRKLTERVLFGDDTALS